MKRLMTLAIALFGLLIAPVAQGADNDGFPEPLDVMKAFGERLSNGDLEGVVSLFDYHKAFDQFNPALYLSKAGTFAPNASIEPISPGYKELHKIAAQAKASRELLGIIRKLLLPPDLYGDFANNKPQPMKGTTAEELQAEANQFLEYLNPANLKGLSLVRTDAMNTPAAARIKQAAADMYGAQDHQEFLAVFTWNENRHAIGMTLRKFDGKWYIHAIYSPAKNPQATGGSNAFQE